MQIARSPIVSHRVLSIASRHAQIAEFDPKPRVEPVTLNGLTRCCLRSFEIATVLPDLEQRAPRLRIPGTQSARGEFVALRAAMNQVLASYFSDEKEAA